MVLRGTHESLNRSFRKPVTTASNRSFGFVFTAVFLVVSVWPLRREPLPEAIRLPWLAAAAATLVVALVAPALLAPLNRIWTRLGLLLHGIVSPLMLAVLFYGVFTPVGVLMRLAGKDVLRLKFDHESSSYWIPRSGSGSSLKNQF